MRFKFLLIPLALLAFGALACSKKTKYIETPVFYLYQDIYGVVEYEADGTYPPPENLDNYKDDNIVVTLYFGENVDIYRDGDIYGYFITSDNNVENYNFPFVPSGNYWLNAEFTIQDSCFQVKTDKFYHSDTVATVTELRPRFIGLNLGCFYAGLSAVNEGEYVQVGERCWVRKEVYERYYKDREATQSPLEP